jgi:mRNA-degrading endonuclease RelE of RelBE toxin-antitoxin system
LDDIICFTPTFEDHIEALRKIFYRLHQANLSLKPSKCEFGKDKIQFLGHIVSASGIEPVEDKIKNIENAQPPTTGKGVRQFLGLAGYYRKHIKDYRIITAPLTPLTDLTKGEGKSIIWTPQCQEAFDTLKYALTHAPVLAYPIYSDPFTLTTDASKYATGAILSQVCNNKEVVIAYGERKLSTPEQNYTTTE